MVDEKRKRGEMPFLDHLEELRWRIIKVAIAVIAGSMIGFLLVHYFEVPRLLTRPIEPHLGGEKLKFFSPTDPFFITLKLAVLVGIIFAFPILVHQTWSFLSPALKPRERRVILPSLFMGLVLFSAGVAMAYFIALPVTLSFLLGFETRFLEQSIEFNLYMGFVVRLLLAFGVVFELPVVVMILSMLGLVTPKGLRSKRRHAFLGITILASLLSPGDAFTVTFLMMVPLVLLYEVSILLSVVIHRRKRKEEERSDPAPGPPPGHSIQARP